jgi:hypothetical protein
MEDDFSDLPTFMVQKKGKKKKQQIKYEDDAEVAEEEKPNLFDQSLKVVALLREKPLKDVLKQYKLSCKSHTKHPNLCQLSYSQLESPMGSPIVQECRGLVLTLFAIIYNFSDLRPSK